MVCDVDELLNMLETKAKDAEMTEFLNRPSIKAARGETG